MVMAILFYIWGFLGLMINGGYFLTLPDNVGVATSAYLTAGTLVWVGGMIFFGLGGLASGFPNRLRGFEPHAIYKGTPYRKLGNGGIDAIFAGGRVRFQHMHGFTDAVDGQTGALTDAPELKRLFPPVSKFVATPEGRMSFPKVLLVVAIIIFGLAVLSALMPHR